MNKMLLVLFSAVMPEHFVVFAQAIQDGLQALKQQDYQTALRTFRPLAEQGDAAAQSTLGAMYVNGWGVVKNPTEGLKWFRKAADRGSPAQFNLGVAYERGQGVPQNDVEAANWFRRAADQGNPPGEYNLGNMYRDGRGVPKNEVEALNWFRQAADQGDGSAQYDLGMMYETGSGLRRTMPRRRTGIARPPAREMQ